MAETDEQIYLRYLAGDDDSDLETLLSRHRDGLLLFLLSQYLNFVNISPYIFLYLHPRMDVMVNSLSADEYPYTYPISSRWVYALTFLHSALWIKARGRLVLECCLIGLMEESSLSPCHYRLFYYQAAALSCSLRTCPNTLPGS